MEVEHVCGWGLTSVATSTNRS
eukprot:SAG22_NODE_13570_length_402_cov_0.709571_2_plen_21_part_01